MAIIGNPYAQDAAAFGQQAGNALAQGLIGLPQQRYAMALHEAGLRQQMLRNQQVNEYRQGLLGVRQQGLENHNANEQMANQIRLMMAQIAQQNAARGHVEGGYYIPGAGQMPQGLQQGGDTNSPPQQVGGLPNGIVALPKPPSTMTPNEQVRAALDAGRLYAGALSSTNIPNMDPRFTSTMSNLFYRGLLPTQPQQQQVAMPQGLGTNNIAQANTNRIGRFLVEPVQ